ncbi:MAG: tail fiber domain-containing protein [Anaerolineae bacterium]
MHIQRTEFVTLCVVLLLSTVLAIVLRPDVPVVRAEPDSPAAVVNIPLTFNYQGILRDIDGSLITGERDITLKIYDSPIGGTELHSETITGVPVREGIFNAVLGDATSIGANVFADAPRYLGITVAPDPEMVPRQRLHPVPWAAQASTVPDGSVTTAKLTDGAVTGAKLEAGSITNDKIANGAVTTAKLNLLAGSVGIGTTSPLARLHVGGTYVSGAVLIHNYEIKFENYGRAHWSIFNDPGTGDFRINNTSAASGPGLAGSNTVTVKTWGGVGIGTTSPGYKLDVAGEAHATSHPSSSDARLKTDITQLTNVLEKLERIRGVSFEWNELYKSLGRSTGHREIGVIAQEIEAVFPELVTTWGDEEYRAVDYGRLTGVLIEAIKELRAEKEAQITALEAENAAQQAEIDTLSNAGPSPAENVSVLRSKVAALEDEVAALKTENAAMDARISALESADTTSGLPQGWPLAGGLVVMGLILGFRIQNREGQL